jgi:hypothetical protein
MGQSHKAGAWPHLNLFHDAQGIGCMHSESFPIKNEVKMSQNGSCDSKNCWKMAPATRVPRAYYFDAAMPFT